MVVEGGTKKKLWWWRLRAGFQHGGFQGGFRGRPVGPGGFGGQGFISLVYSVIQEWSVHTPLRPTLPAFLASKQLVRLLPVEMMPAILMITKISKLTIFNLYYGNNLNKLIFQILILIHSLELIVVLCVERLPQIPPLHIIFPSSTTGLGNIYL